MSTLGVPRWLERAAAIAWRLIVLAAGVYLLLVLIGRLRVALFPVVVAVFLTRVLIYPVEALTRRRWRRSLAAALVVIGFVGVVLGATSAMVAVVTREVEELGPTLRTAVDDIERWLVQDAPFDLDAEQVARWRTQIEDAAGDALRSSQGHVVSGAVLVVEALVGAILAIFLTFFALRDGPRLTAKVRRFVPAQRRELADRVARRAWSSLAGYLRGSALLGVVEGIIIGVTMTIVGAELAIVVAALTFVAAFVPFLGAIVAGVVAALVSLATGGVDAALVVVIVALIVQQLDNDLLAPVVYGRALRLHPAAVLLSVAAGGALFGLAGSALAVPVIAVATNVIDELRADPGAPDERVIP